MKKQTCNTSKTSSANGLSSTEICNILESAGKSGVKHFMYGDLEFVIGEMPVSIQDSEVNLLDMKPVLDNNEDSTNTIQDDKHIDLGQLALSDPEAYEEYVSGTHDG